VQLTLFVGATQLCIKPDLPLAVLRELKRTFTFTVPGYQYTRQHRLMGWDGSICLVKRNQELPLGCLHRLSNYLKKQDYEVNIVYANECAPKGKIEVADLTLDSFQIRAVKRALKYRYGVLMAPMRSGKTAIMGAVVNAIGHYPVWLVTSGSDLVVQSKIDLEKHLNCKIGFFSESEYCPGDVTLTSYQALTAACSGERAKKAETKRRNVKIQKELEKAKVLILDECHHAVSPKFEKILGRFKNAAYRIGLSATPKPDKVPLLEFESKLGSVISLTPYQTLIDQGRLAKPLIVMYDLPYAWYTSYLPTYADVQVSNLVDNLMRNRFIARITEKLKEQGKTVFIKVTRLDHGNNLHDMIPGSVFVQGSMASSIRKGIYQALQDKTIHCVIATVGKEGLNLPKLDAVINAEGMRSRLASRQKMRSLTAAEGKKYGLIIDFIDKGKYLRKHARKRLALYKGMTGFKVQIKKVSKDLFPMEGSRWQLK